MLESELVHTPDCPHTEPTAARLREVADDLGIAIDLRETAVDSPDDATAARMFGSPTLRIAGRDLEAPMSQDREPSLACRLYDGDGTPPRWMVETALLRESEIDHLLFLCVANSARSQIADGLARRLVDRHDHDTRISSAGSNPGQIRNGAVDVLHEVGIDPTDQFSKGFDAVDTDSVDTVLTLCAEEACPAHLGDARRLHWPLPDPAGVERGDDGLDAFREVRDELQRRLTHLFG